MSTFNMSSPGVVSYYSTYFVLFAHKLNRQIISGKEEDPD